MRGVEVELSYSFESNISIRYKIHEDIRYDISITTGKSRVSCHLRVVVRKRRVLFGEVIVVPIVVAQCICNTAILSGMGAIELYYATLHHTELTASRQ